MSRKDDEPKIKTNITVYYMNGDVTDFPKVWEYTENQVALQLVYENFHTDIPMCNIKSIQFQCEDLE